MPTKVVDVGRSHALFAGCAIVLALASNAAEDPGRSAPISPCVNLQPVPGPLGYAQRGAGQRCEGLYIAQVAASPLAVISLYSEPVPSRDTISVLSVATQQPPATEVTITAVATSPEVFYRLDARLNSAVPVLSISGADVLFAAGLRFSDLAFSGHIGPRLVPLVLSDATHPLQRSGKPQAFLLQFRISRPIKALYWRLEHAAATPSAWTSYAEDLSTPYAVGRLRLSDSGLVDLVIKAEDTDDDWTISRTPLSLP
jgi:hypothetical protein